MIGSGLVFRSHLPEQFLGIDKGRARDWSRRFTELLHFEKLAADYYALQSELAREAKITGDALLFIRYRHDGTVNFIPFGGWAIDWESENLGIVLKSNAPVGVVLQSTGRRAYFKSRATGDLQLLLFRYAARPRQLRGFSCYYSEIARAKNLDRWWDATLERAVLESVQMGFFSGDSRAPGMQAAGLAKRAIGKDGKQTGSPSEMAHNMKPGSMYVLENNESMTFTDLKTPSGTFGIANEWTWNTFSSAVGYPPEFLVGKYTSSFTAHKGALNDAWLKIRQERAHFASVVERRVNEVLLRKLVREGKLEIFGDINDRVILEAHLQGTYLGPIPGHINPKIEVEAHKAAVEAGFMLRSDAAVNYGGNFNDFIDEWGEQEARWASLSARQQAETLIRDAQEVAHAT